MARSLLIQNTFLLLLIAKQGKSFLDTTQKQSKKKKVFCNLLIFLKRRLAISYSIYTIYSHELIRIPKSSIRTVPDGTS